MENNQEPSAQLICFRLSFRPVESRFLARDMLSSMHVCGSVSTVLVATHADKDSQGARAAPALFWGHLGVEYRRGQTLLCVSPTTSPWVQVGLLWATLFCSVEGLLQRNGADRHCHLFVFVHCKIDRHGG